MLNQEEDVLKEIFVKVGKGSTKGFDIPKAVVNHYRIESGDGIRCVLKEKLDIDMENAKKIDKEILIDVDDSHPTRGHISEGTCKLYNIGDGHYLRLLIKAVIHKRQRV